MIKGAWVRLLSVVGFLAGVIGASYFALGTEDAFVVLVAIILCYVIWMRVSRSHTLSLIGLEILLATVIGVLFGTILTHFS